MKKRKSVLAISVTCVSVIAIIVGLCCFVNSITPKTYSSAREVCVKVLNKHQTEMEQTAIDSLRYNNSGSFRDYFYNCYREESFVKFNIDAQGFLGGQYWELVYTQDGTFYGETESYLYEENDGNNIVRAEKINEQWWYLWTDYDGTERSYQ